MRNDLPEGWIFKKLGDISKIKAGGTPSRGKNEYWQNGNIPWVKITDMKEKYITKTSEFINEMGLKNSSAHIIPKGTVLISIFASLGEVGILDIDATCNQAIAGIQVFDNKVDKIYLYYYLKNKKDYFISTGRGVAQNNINQQILKETEIIVPPIETQHKIVALLEKAEETKKLRLLADELTQKLLQNLFLNMFGDPITNPKDWIATNLNEISEIVSGVTKGRNLNGKSTVFVPYVRVANVQDGYLDLKEIKEIEVLPSDIEKYALQNGDVLLTEGGDPDKLGRGYLWNCQIPVCIHQNHIFRVRVNREYLVPEYLSMLIGNAYGKMYFLKSAKQTTGIATINSTQLKNFPVLIPPLGLQLRFAKVLHEVERISTTQKQSSLEINNLFDALMQKAFSGELKL